MKQLFTYILIFIATLLLFNCKKYPEGGCERRGPKNIIGDWKLTLYEVNGIDSTDLINYNGDDRYKKINISKNGSNFSINTSGYTGYSLNFTNENQKLSFSNENINSGVVCKTNVNNTSTQNCYRTFFIPESNVNSINTEWTILKLKKDEIILSFNKTNSYKIKLSK